MEGQIAQLNVIDSDLDRRTAQRRARQVLGRLRLQPDGMPAEAILCVQHFEDPLPQTLPLQGYRPRELQRWQRASNAELTRLYREAYAPARGHVPPSAEAVIFADYADLLACMAVDWLSGRLIQRWWWQHWIENRPVDEAVHRAWLREPVYAPAALARLTYRVDFARRLPDDVVIRLARAVVHTYALPPALLESVEALASGATVAAPPAQVDQARVSPPAQDLPEPGGLADVPEHAAPGLSIAQRRLLLIALTLVRRPCLARQERFAAVALRRLRELDLASAERQIARPQAGIPQPAATALPAEAPASERAAPPAEKPSPLRLAPPQAPLETPPDDTTSRQVDQVRPLPDVALAPVASTAIVRTAYGGLFYMVNVALFLKLYGDFSAPREPGLELPPWDFLALIGLEWFQDDFRADPLWSLLAELAGRDSETMPGDGVPTPDEWRVPAHWLGAFPEPGVCRWQAAQGRLRVWHPAGFMLLDLPAAARLSEEMSAYDLPYNLEPGLEMQAEVVINWAGWMRRFLPYLQARLARAVGHEDVRDVCRVPARISQSETHLEINMRLDDINLPARQAGLDRDPGWVPAVGRFIHFHFD